LYDSESNIKPLALLDLEVMSLLRE